MNINNNGNDYLRDIESSHNLRDYLNLIRNNLVPVLIITLSCLVLSIAYAINSMDIYKSDTSLKISKPSGSILESPIMPGFSDFGNDRFIANEIEILKSYNLRERVAQALLDSFYTNKGQHSFYVILNREDRVEKTNENELLSQLNIAKRLSGLVSIEQKKGLDIIEISAESPSPYEAALIANTYAKEYKFYNLEINRDQLTLVKEFLQTQRLEKQEDLKDAEDILRNYQQKGGIVALDAQAQALIQQVSSFDANLNAAKIEYEASQKILNQYRSELEKQNPKLADYLNSFASESYIKALQDEIAKLEINRDVVLSDKAQNSNIQSKIDQYDKKIEDLKGKLNKQIEIVKAGIFASSPDEVKALSQKIIEEEIKNRGLSIRIEELQNVVNRYESRFNELPKSAIELARLQRMRESLEKLYLLVEEKYQEALINEQSQPGNVLIVDDGRVPSNPSKPNRQLIILVGLVLGLLFSVGFVFTKNYFDNSVKTPEDVQNRGINVLAWIPQIEGVEISAKEYEFIVAKKPDSIPSEAFRALRTRIQFSKLNDAGVKKILITSSTPQEGKTTVTVNLAGTFAQSGKKTLIVDCDLRKPRMHNLLGAERYPGLIDYLFGNVDLNEIIRHSEINNLDYITAGTIPPNPAEMIQSQQMHDFFAIVEKDYDIILIDSPPVIAVTDSEILARMVDVSILVVSADTTEIELMEKAASLLKLNNTSFVGAVLNNFSYKAGYGSYYKYYYYYSQGKNGAESKKIKA